MNRVEIALTEKRTVDLADRLVVFLLAIEDENRQRTELTDCCMRGSNIGIGMDSLKYSLQHVVAA